MRKSDYNDKFNWFTNMFVAILSIALATYAIELAGGELAMTQSLPPAVVAFLVLAGILAVAATYNGIRMLRTPKDTRLDELIEAGKGLQKTKDDNNPKISIDIKIDTADMAKMKKEQMDAVNAILDRLQGKK